MPPGPPVGLPPVPVKATEAAAVDCPLMIMLNVPLAGPPAVGMKVTEAVAVPPFAVTGRLVGDTLKGPVALSVAVVETVPLFVIVMF